MSGADQQLSHDDLLGSVVPDSLIALSPEGTIVGWNDGAQRLYGFSSAQALGRPVHELLTTRHPFGLDHLACELAREGQWSGELYRVTADGRSVGVKVRLANRGNGSTARIEWSRGLSDVSLEEIAAHRYTNLFNAMAASFWELDFSKVRLALGELAQSGITDIPQHLLENDEFIDRVIPLVSVLDVNDKTLELFEIKDKDAALAGGIDWAWPAESRSVFAGSLIAALARDDRFTVETVLNSTSGRPLDVLFTVCWPSDHKAQGSVLVGVIDLCETKRAFRQLLESEQHYRDLFQHMPVALLRLDLTGLNAWLEQLGERGILDRARYLEANPGLLEEILQQPRIVDANAEALHLFGVEALERLEGPIDWAWRDRPDTILRSLFARLRGDAEFSEETRINLPDGGSVDVLYVISFAQDQAERGYNVVGLLDITGRKRAEEELRVAREELSHAARISMLGELTASIAHEVNQPLAAISALADANLRWLGRPEPDLEEVRSLTGDIAADARRASDIISRIRALAVKQTGATGPVDLNALANESLLILKHDSDARGVRVALEQTPGLPEVLGDRIQLQQVIVNLVVNAMQAISSSESDERAIVVRTSLEGDDEVQMLVEDSGPGISPQHLDQLFDSFFTTKSTGMGLGLSVCRSIVEGHGGRIWAENHARGARFGISLPRA